jgi:hypothetical protein
MMFYVDKSSDYDVIFECFSFENGSRYSLEPERGQKIWRELITQQISKEHQDFLTQSLNLEQNGSLTQLPISLLGENKAFLLFSLLPELDEQSLFAQFIFLNSLAEEAMFDALYDHYNYNKLGEYSSVEELLGDFAQFIAQWFLPRSYTLFGQSIAHHLIEMPFPEFDFRINVSFETNQEIIYQIQCSEKIRENLFPFNSVQEIRRLSLQHRLEKFMEHIYHNWRDMQLNVEKEILGQTMQTMLKLSDLLEQTKTVIGYRLSSTDEPEKSLHLPTQITTDVYPFAFFKNMYGKWQVHFNGQDCSKDIKDIQGMNVLHILLSNPEKQFAPDDLYQMLENAGRTYSTEGKAKPLDPSIAKKYDQELKDLINFWEDNKSQSITELISRDEYGEKFRELLRCIDRKLIQTRNNRSKYQELKTEVQKRLKRMNIINFEKDPLFQGDDPEVTQPPPNTRDTIQKNIKAALDQFQGFPELMDYWSKTIVRVKEGNFRPFSFQPKGFQNDLESNLSALGWYTDKDAEE